MISLYASLFLELPVLFAPLGVCAELRLVNHKRGGENGQIVDIANDGDLIRNQVFAPEQVDDRSHKRDNHLRRDCGVFSGDIAADHGDHEGDFGERISRDGDVFDFCFQLLEQRLNFGGILDQLFRLTRQAGDGFLCFFEIHAFSPFII